jgi:hypothetical protein
MVRGRGGVDGEGEKGWMVRGWEGWIVRGRERG